MTTYNDVERFLQAVFPDHATRAVFACSVKPRGMRHTRDLTVLDNWRDCYWSIAAFPDDGSIERTTARATEVRALVIDDVGTLVGAAQVALALGAPTARVETSAGNEQWVYRLAQPVAVKDWARFFAEVERLVGVKLECRDAVHLFRLPMGVNTKPERGGFHVHLVGVTTSVLQTENIVVNNVREDQSYRDTGSAVAQGSGSKPKAPRVRDIRRLMKLIPNNDVHYDEWEATGERCKAIAIDKAEAEEAFVEWSAKSSKDGVKRDTRYYWRTFKANITAGLELFQQAEAADPKGFKAFMDAEAAGVFDDGAEPPPPAAGAAGADGVEFALGANDEILKSMENAARGLTGLGVVCRRDMFHHRIDVSGKRLTDDMLVDMRVLLIKAYGKDFGLVHIYDAVMALASQNKFNPVVDMLAGAEMLWDGVKRLDRLGPDYFNTDDTALARACVRKVMIAAVRRARRPGCKFDQILVLESPEGWNKSSAWAVLAGEGNFSDASILGKDAREVQEALADIWIHENSDLSGLSKAEVEHVKAFASRQNDRARPAYGRVLVDQPRQSIEVGTTNADAYLLSPTGNRRFWTFTVGAPIDLGALERDRLALWGEAAAAETAGETLVLDPALWGAAEAEAEKRRVIDPWEDELGNLSGHMAVKMRRGREFISRVAVHEILRQRGQTVNAGSGKRIAEIMRKLGWEDRRYKIDGEAVRGFERDPVNPAGGLGDIFGGDNVTDQPPENIF